MSLPRMHDFHHRASTLCAKQPAPCCVSAYKRAASRIQQQKQPYLGTAARDARRSCAGAQLKRSRRQSGRCFAGQWLENSAEQDVTLPVERCFEMWEDRERIPQWMPWIQSVKVLPEDTKLSRWTLSTNQFGRDWAFSWVSQNMTPIPMQKIHWRSVQGSTGGSLGGSIDISNRGQIRFYRKSPTTCTVKLTISYEVPDVLAPFAGALTPIVESILSTDLKRFANLAAQEPLSA